MDNEVNDTDALDELNELWSEASVFSLLQANRWATNERLVNSRHLTSRKLGRSALFIPKIAGYVRRKQADYVGNFTGQSPITITPSITASLRGAKVLQKVVNHYLDTKIQWVSNIYNAAYDALVNEFSPTYVWWQVETSTQDVPVVQPNGRTKLVKQEVVTDSYPIVENIPPENVRIDPSVGWHETDQARYIAFSAFRDQSYAEMRAAQGDWPKLDPNQFTTNPAWPLNPLENERRSTSSPFRQELDVEDNRVIEVRTHFYWDEVDGFLQPVIAETLADHTLLSGPTPMPYMCAEDGNHAWPLIVGHVYPKPHEQYAAAMPELLQSLQLETNAIRNQRRDNVSLILNPEKIISPDSGIDPANMAFSFPGKVVVAQNPDGIRWEAPPDVTAAGYQEESVVTNDMDRLVSEGPARAGAPTQRKETATQSQIMAAGSSAAVNLDMTLFASSYVEPIIRRIALLATQAAPIEIFEAAAAKLGIKDETFDPLAECSTGNFIYNVFAGSTQAELANEISTSTNIIAIIQQVYGPHANYQPIAAKLLEAAGYDPDEIVVNPQGAVSGQPQLPHPGFADFGGVQPAANPNVQPRAAVQGGGFDILNGG